MNLLLPFLGHAERWSGRAAIVEAGGRSASFGDIARRSAALAAGWRRAGIGPGDRVLVAMPLGIELYAAIAGLWRLGAAIVFPEPALGLGGLRHAAAITRPKAFLTAGWYGALRFVARELLRIPLHVGIAEGRGDGADCYAAGDAHPALISFTSGSTGAPKGIARSHGFLAAQNACIAGFLAPKRGGEIDLVAFPVFVVANLGLGVTSVLPNWRPSRGDSVRAENLVAWMRETRVTRLLAPPSLCEIIADAEAKLELAAVFTGGGPVFPDLLMKLSGLLPKAEIVSVYGSTEAEPIAYQALAGISAEDWTAMRGGTGLLAGAPVDAIRLELVDDEIVVTGPHVNKSYLDGRGDSENKTVIDGAIWHRTGDAGRLDARGRLWLLGRRDARAGAVYPFQVEAAARLWPGVRRVALVPGSAPPLLAVEGDPSNAPTWRHEAESMGLRIREMRIPLDRRHRAKVDYIELQRRIAGQRHDRA
jgi:acyl-coenzyme A synthetase/AMP-(fatty) acid ligase